MIWHCSDHYMLHLSSIKSMVYSIQKPENGRSLHHGSLHCMILSSSSADNTDFSRSNGARAGEVIGLLINGYISEKYGFRKTMIASLMMMTGAIFLLFFAPNVKILVLGEVVCGIPWGVFQTLTTQYASEVSPVVLRPYLTTFVNM